jgi:CheY-like chemotaxis protein
METLLKHRIDQCGKEIESTDHAVVRAEEDIIAVFEKFFSQIASGRLMNLTEIRDARKEMIEPRLRAVAEMLSQMTQSADKFRQASGPHLESIHSLNALAKRVQPTVLIVDDDEFQRNIIRKILEPMNYRVVSAAGGIEALNILYKERPDLILMDVMMPDMNGLDVVQKIKALPQFANIPVIMVTGKSEKTIVTESLKAGAIDFVVKPLDREKLIAKVAGGLRANISATLLPWDSSTSA